MPECFLSRMQMPGMAKAHKSRVATHSSSDSDLSREQEDRDVITNPSVVWRRGVRFHCTVKNLLIEAPSQAGRWSLRKEKFLFPKPMAVWDLGKLYNLPLSFKTSLDKREGGCGSWQSKGCFWQGETSEPHLISTFVPKSSWAAVRGGPTAGDYQSQGRAEETQLSWNRRRDRTYKRKHKHLFLSGSLCVTHTQICDSAFVPQTLTASGLLGLSVWSSHSPRDQVSTTQEHVRCD